MILRRVKVQGVRCFRNPVELGPLGDGINIIFAPNESGKSTLVEAVARALFDKYSVGGEKLEALRPWGTSLAPHIELDFDAGTKSYRVEKRLLDSADSQLFELFDGRSEKLHERERADDFLREMMAGEEAKRGVTQSRHWGVACMLWSLQSPGSDPFFSVPDAVAQQLRHALPNCAMPGQTSLTALLAKIESRHEIYFTDTGRAKKTSPILKVEEDIAQLKVQCALAKEAYERAEGAAADIARVERELATLHHEKAEQQQKIEQLQGAVARVGELTQSAELLGKDVEGAQKAYDAVAGAHARYEAASAALAAAKAELQRLARERDAATTDRKAAEMLLSEARAAQAEAETVRRTADADRKRGRQVTESLSLLRALDALREKLARLTALSQQLQALDQRLHQTPCPTVKEIAAVRELATQAVRLQAQLQAVGLSAVIEAESDRQVTVGCDDDATGRHVMTAGTAIPLLAETKLDIHVPGVMRILVKSGAAEPVQVSAELADVLARKADILARYGAADDAALAVQRDEWLNLERGGKAIQAELAAHAVPHADIPAVSEAIAATTHDLTIRCNQLNTTVEAARQLAPVELERLEAAYQAADAECEKLGVQMQGRLQQYEQHREAEAAKTAAMQTRDAEATRHDAEMTAALGGMNCRDAGELTALVAMLGAALQERSEKLAAVTAELPAPGTGPDALLATARAAIDEIVARERELDSQRMRYRIEVEHAQIEGRYEHLAELDETLAAKSDALARARRDAQAIRLLRQVILTCREDMTTGQLPDVESAVSRMLQAITGKPRPIAMAADFSVAAVRDERTPAGHSEEELSAGTREQLDLVMRIALGEAYAREYGRSMMVLDDALLYTDPTRHDRVKEILKIAAQSLQIFIFTSHPERYRGITPSAYQFDLAQLASSAREAMPV